MNESWPFPLLLWVFGFLHLYLVFANCVFFIVEGEKGDLNFVYLFILIGYTLFSIYILYNLESHFYLQPLVYSQNERFFSSACFLHTPLGMLLFLLLAWTREED